MDINLIGKGKEYKIGHKTISYKLPALGVFFVLVVIIGLISMKRPSVQYRLSTEEILTKAMEMKHVVRPPKLLDILYNKKELYRFIDLRPADEYIKGHLEGAINIPLNKLLSEEYRNILNQDEKINVFYCSRFCEACGAWMLLTQIGYKNNMVMQGDYEYVTEHIIKDYSPMSGFFQDEKPYYDYAKIAKKGGGGGSAANASAPKAPAIKIKKRGKQEEEEGGC